MEVITIEEFCRFMSSTREEADVLLQWRVLETVKCGEETLIAMPSVTALIERLEAGDS